MVHISLNTAVSLIWETLNIDIKLKDRSWKLGKQSFLKGEEDQEMEGEGREERERGEKNEEVLCTRILSPQGTWTLCTSNILIKQHRNYSHCNKVPPWGGGWKWHQRVGAQGWRLEGCGRSWYRQDQSVPFWNWEKELSWPLPGFSRGSCSLFLGLLLLPSRLADSQILQHSRHFFLYTTLFHLIKTPVILYWSHQKDFILIWLHLEILFPNKATFTSTGG